tara:strand:- start:880 stop:1122 length:243 start_codon:yes stop_codon:yes gene_type:complete
MTSLKNKTHRSRDRTSLRRKPLVNLLYTSKNNTIMTNPKPLTKNQTETLKKLQLKQMEWEKNKKQIKTAKDKAKAKSRTA